MCTSSVLYWDLRGFTVVTEAVTAPPVVVDASRPVEETGLGRRTQSPKGALVGRLTAECLTWASHHALVLGPMYIKTEHRGAVLQGTTECRGEEK